MMSPYLAMAMLGAFALVIGAVVFGGTLIAYALGRRAAEQSASASDRSVDTPGPEQQEAPLRRAA